MRVGGQPPRCTVSPVLDKGTLRQIRQLVGPITEQQLRHVESATGDGLGIFIPATGQCRYAIVPQHVHPAYSLVIALDPASPVAPKGVTVREHEYGATAMSPNVPHQEDPSDTFYRYIAIMIEPARFRRVWRAYTPKPCGPFEWTPFVVDESVVAHIKEFIAEFELRRTPRDVLRALGVCITHGLVRALLGIEAPLGRVSARFEIQQAVELMHARFGEKLSVSSLARSVHQSESHFGRIFKQETGLSPMEYLTRVRLDKARRLLSRTDKRVSQVALECGFASGAHFSSVFRKSTGIRPKDFRRHFG
jgi:AraC family transcriptional regulator